MKEKLGKQDFVHDLQQVFKKLLKHTNKILQEKKATTEASENQVKAINDQTERTEDSSKHLNKDFRKSLEHSIVKSIEV